MDLNEQLRALFPDHKSPEPKATAQGKPEFWIQDAPLSCKFEKRKGKPVAIIEGYTGADKDFKVLTKKLKTRFSTGGSYKNEVIIIQGDFRDKIMDFLQGLGFKTKRVGG